MNFSESNSEIPSWILHHLKKYGNCCCGRDIVKKIGRDEIINLLKTEGYDCILRVIPDKEFPPRRKTKYPIHAYYILEIECLVRSYFIEDL